MNIRTITSRFWKLQYGFHQIVMSCYKLVKETRRKKKVNKTRLRLVVIHLFFSNRSYKLITASINIITNVYMYLIRKTYTKAEQFATIFLKIR